MNRASGVNNANSASTSPLFAALKKACTTATRSTSCAAATPAPGTEITMIPNRKMMGSHRKQCPCAFSATAISPSAQSALSVVRGSHLGFDRYLVIAPLPLTAGQPEEGEVD